jgi:ParB-like chromosome segregation protein Spo0J
MMETIDVPIKDLIPNDKNPRRITKREMQKLIRSIEEFGFVDPVIVNKNSTRYNIIVGGHQRVEAAKKMKLDSVPVTYVDLTEDKEQLLNIALNEISGEWDDDKLLDLLKELEERGADLTLSGFDEPILDEILARNNWKGTERRMGTYKVYYTSPGRNIATENV